MNPEWYEPLMAGLFAAGALDVALAPIQMKKNRPGVRLTVVAPLAAKAGLLDRIFADSTTLGVRLMEVERVTARRWPETIETALRPAAGQGDGIRRPPPPAAGIRGLPPNGRSPGPAPNRHLPPGSPGVTGGRVSGRKSGGVQIMPLLAR